MPRRVSIPIVRISKAAARRFMIRAVRLEEPHAGIAEAIDYHGYVQIDPINVCGRMHDLILRNRVSGYREGGLIEFLYSGERRAFESYHPVHGVLAAYPTGDWRFQMHRMRRRATNTKGYYGRLTRSESPVAEAVLAEIARRGPLSPADVDAGPRRRTAWGARGTLGRKVCEKLFVHGRLVIARREQFRRVYDLPERVLPASILSEPEPTKAEFERWATLSVLKQRRLVVFRKSDVAHVDDLVARVQIEDGPQAWCLRSDMTLLERAASDGPLPADGAPRLLAPLDPLIYDRRITSRLWDFDYTWEVYTPPEKRRRGYYALPVLANGAIVGHVDPKADRGAGRLRVVSRRAPRGVKLAPAVRELAGFLGLK